MFLGLSSTLGPPGGPGGQSKRGARGASFLKICILGIFGDISSNLSYDRCQKPPKNNFDSQVVPGGQVNMGHRGVGMQFSLNLHSWYFW